jgi:hypothetical protein
MMILLVTSDWQSVCGRNAELVQSLVPVRRNNSVHMLLVKMGSQSLTIDIGMPWSRMMPLKNALATDAAE